MTVAQLMIHLSQVQDQSSEVLMEDLCSYGEDRPINAVTLLAPKDRRPQVILLNR